MEQPTSIPKWIEFLTNHGKNHIVTGNDMFFIDAPDSKEHRLDAILFGTAYKFDFNETTFVVYLNTENIALLVDVYNNPLKTTKKWANQSNQTKWHERNK